MNATNPFSAPWATGADATKNASTAKTIWESTDNAKSPWDLNVAVDDLDTGWGDVAFGTSGVGSSTNWMPTSIEKGGKVEATLDASAPKSSRTFAPIDEDTGWGAAAWATTEPSAGENNNTSPDNAIAPTPVGRSSFTTTTSQAIEDNRKEEASVFSHDRGSLTEQPHIRTAANKITLSNSRWGKKLASPSETTYSSRTPVEPESKRSAFSPPDTRNSSTMDIGHITNQTKDNAKDPRGVHSKRVSWDDSAQKARLDLYFRTPFSYFIISPGEIPSTKRDRGQIAYETGSQDSAA